MRRSNRNHSDPSSDPEEAAIQLDNTEVLKLAIGKLSAGQREAVEHLALEGQSPEQAATLPAGRLDRSE